MIPIEDRIIQIITGHDGIKASRLCAELACEYLKLSGPDIRKTVISVIQNEELVEIEYILPNGRHESLLLPNGTRIRGISQVEDLGEITFDGY